MKLSSQQIQKIWHKVDLDGGLSIVDIDVSWDKNLSKKDNNLNVYCVDTYYNIIWRVDAELSPFPGDYFVSLKREGGIIKASRFHGFEFEIDEMTGVAKMTGWHK